MTTEEKAKAYDEALKWMRELYPGLHGATKEDAEHYFPELRESEDERIRKEMIAYFAHRADVTEFIDEGEDCKRWISYLEKQKEQKPAEWSEEDEKIIGNIRHLLFGLAFENGGVDVNGDYCKDVYIQADDFLKSLRPSWKPSEEQMNCLCAAVDAAIRKHNESVSGYKPARVLKSLYEQLKKL